MYSILTTSTTPCCGSVLSSFRIFTISRYCTLNIIGWFAFAYRTKYITCSGRKFQVHKRPGLVQFNCLSWFSTNLHPLHDTVQYCVVSARKKLRDIDVSVRFKIRRSDRNWPLLDVKWIKSLDPFHLLQGFERKRKGRCETKPWWRWWDKQKFHVHRIMGPRARD